MKLLIATPAYGGQVSTDYVGSLLNTLRYCHEERHEVGVYFVKNESLICRARNNCASYMLREEYDKMLFIDADESWSPDDIDLLLKSERTLIGGTYSKKTLPCDLNFTPLPEHDAEFFPDGARSAERYVRYTKKADANGEIEVRHLPTGFLLIDRKVLEDLRPGVPSYLAKDSQHAEETRHYDFFPAGVIGGGYESEDFFFCSQAAAAGHKPYLQTRVIVDHWGQVNYRTPRNLLWKEAPNEHERERSGAV